MRRMICLRNGFFSFASLSTPSSPFSPTDLFFPPVPCSCIPVKKQSGTRPRPFFPLTYPLVAKNFHPNALPPPPARVVLLKNV